MVHILLPLALAFGSTDQISIVHPHPDGKQPLRLEVHEPFNGWTLSEPVASDKKFFRSGGSRPVRFVFGADADADGHDEVVVIQQRMKKSDRYELRVHSAPKKLGKNVGKPLAIAGKTALGAPSTHGMIVSAASIDANGDGLDEIMLLRQSSDGMQRIEIRGLSLSKKPDVSIQSSWTEVGQFPFDAVQQIAAIDMDGNGYEEIALMRGSGNTSQRLQVIRPPAFIDDLTPTPLINTELGLGPNILAMDATDLGYGIDSLLVLVPVGDDSAWMRFENLSQLDLNSLPQAHGHIAGTPEHFFVLRGPSENVNQPFEAEDLVGEYSGTFSHSVPLGYYGGVIEDVIDADGFSIDIDESTASLSLADQSLEAAFSSFFKEFTFADETIVIESGGVTLELTLLPANATSFNGDLSIEGSYMGTRTTVSGTIAIPIGKYVFTQK